MWATSELAGHPKKILSPSPTDGTTNCVGPHLSFFSHGFYLKQNKIKKTGKPQQQQNPPTKAAKGGKALFLLTVPGYCPSW